MYPSSKKKQKTKTKKNTTTNKKPHKPKGVPNPAN